jgi:hypothetical protein
VSKKKLLLCVPLLLLISIASFFPFYLEGIRGDCRPDQIDGQCGLSTFLGMLYGGGTSIAILIVGGIALAIVHVQKRKAGEQAIDLNDNERK